MSALRLLIFDCDGTLVDSAAHIVRAMENAFRSHGLTPPPDAAIRGIIGLSLPDAMVALAADESEAHDDLVAAYKVHYRDAMVREALAEPLYPGVMEMLDAVSTEATLLGVATGKSRHGLNRILESHQLKGRFVTTVTADEAASKPAPEMVEIALKASGAERAKTVVIGDSTFDIVMARAAGVRAIGVSWGYQSPEELRAAGAHAIAERMDEIAPLAAKLVGP